MKLEVKKFAKIAEANIEIDGITILAGENNTGKSTLGKILYCLFYGFHNLPEKVIEQRMSSMFRALLSYPQINTQQNPAISYEHIYDTIHNIYDSGLDNLDYSLNRYNILLDKSSYNSMQEAFKYEEEKLVSLIIHDIFKNEFNNQIRPLNSKSRNNPEVRLYLKNELAIDLRFNKQFKINKSTSLYNDGIYIDNPNAITSIKYITSEPFNMFRKAMFNSFNSHSEHLSQILANLDKIEIPLIDKEALQARLKMFIKRITDTINGQIILNENNEYVFVESNHKYEVDLDNLSEGIKSFSIILQLLNNFRIKDKSLLLLDEPEVHLHPKWQLIYAELLVLLQKEFDLNIIISTHSPYFINALEAYSAKYKIADKCKYYLTEETDKGIIFNDVTTNTDLIYAKLAEPLLKLQEMEELLRENG